MSRKKHMHKWKEAWTNSVNGQKISVKEHCLECGEYQEVPYVTPEASASPTIIMGKGFGKGLSR